MVASVHPERRTAGPESKGQELPATGRGLWFPIAGLLISTLLACGIRGNPRPPGETPTPPSQREPTIQPPMTNPTSRGPFNPSGPPPDAGPVAADAGFPDAGPP